MSFPVEKITESLRTERDLRDSKRQRQQGQPRRRGQCHDSVTISAEARERLSADASANEHLPDS